MDHGGDILSAAKRFGIDPRTMLDLSTGISPRAWPVPAELLAPADWKSLPQREDEEALMAAAGVAWALPREAALLAAPGSQILISLLPWLRRDARVFVPDPAYGEHARAWQNAGHEIMTYPAGLLPDMAAKTPGRTDVLIVVQPGNPLGETVPVKALVERAADLAESGGLVIVDEAFIDLMPAMSVAPHAGRPGLVVLRSFGKFFGLAGLRLGMALGSVGDIERLSALLGPWATSTLALRVGAAALADRDFAESQRAFLAAGSARFRKILEKHDIAVIGGTDLYALAEVKDAQRLQEFLARAGIWTRIFSYAPGWIRLGLPGDAAAEAQLDKALADWRKHSK